MVWGGGSRADRARVGGGGAGSRLPAALMLRSREWFWRDGAPEPKWIGAGSFGAVYEAEHAGQKVAVKKFFESTASSSGFQREAALLADDLMSQLRLHLSSRHHLRRGSGL